MDTIFFSDLFLASKDDSDSSIFASLDGFSHAYFLHLLESKIIVKTGLRL